jgi:histo-blood group ABO system transferase
MQITNLMDKNIMEKKKIGILCIAINPNYWVFAKNMIESARQHLLVNHDVEYIMWTDMPSEMNYGCTVFETESVPWPYPTLLRYNLFLQQEEYLKKFDYLFYVDLDMLFVNTVGDEILGDGLTMAQHPMYALKRSYIPPYEPNPNSSAYIPRFGQISVDENGKQWFDPLYAAGGFQGGTTESFIKAMKAMKRTIDEDFARNYIAIWNDESHWNKYLSENPPTVVLSPSYVYPDSMIQDYYVKIWGRNYIPRIITITKKFSVSKEAGEFLRNELKNI